MRVLAAARLIALLSAGVSLSACGAKTPTQPTAPVYDLKTETFSGTVNATGSKAFPFTVTNPGDVNLSITALAPISTLTMGLSMGSWDTATSVCAEQLSTSTATLNAVFAATPSAAGEYCIGIFDIGNVQVSSEFTLTVTHY